MPRFLAFLSLVVLIISSPAILGRAAKSALAISISAIVQAPGTVTSLMIQTGAPDERLEK